MRMSYTPKPPIPDRKASGFALKLGTQHALVIYQLYPWLREKGLTDAETDQGLAAIPEFPIPQSEFDQVHKTYDIPSLHWRSPSGFGKTRTTRIQAVDVHAVAKLFMLVGAFVLEGQMGRTLQKRAHDLKNIATTDLLAEAYDKAEKDRVSLTLLD